MIVTQLLTCAFSRFQAWERPRAQGDQDYMSLQVCTVTDQNQTHTHIYTHTIFSRGPTDSFRLLEAILGILEAGIKVRFQLLLNFISQLLEDMVQCSQISRSQVLSPSRMGCQLIFCFHPAPQLLLLKGMDCAYSNGEGDSTTKSMHYLNGRVMCLGKSFKKKSTHTLIFQFCYDQFCGLKPRFALAAANQNKLSAVMAVDRVQVVSVKRPRTTVFYISCQT